MAKKRTKSQRGKAKGAATKRSAQRSTVPTARKRKKSGRPAKPEEAKPRAARPRAAGSVRARRGAGADGTVGVTMKIDFGAGAPGDIQSVRRIDTTELSGAGASISRGKHTAGWDVISPTVRPIAFSVTIVENATAKKVFDRPGQKTGADGRGAGAGTFTV
jgi:hypothetical protein